MVWPELGWTGDRARDRATADGTKIYRHFSYRDLAKRLGHGTNYKGSAGHMAGVLPPPHPPPRKLPAGLLPCLSLDPPRITSGATGRSKPPESSPHHWGFDERSSEDLPIAHTLNEAIAFVPQSMVGQLLNVALCRLWYHHGGRDARPSSYSYRCTITFLLKCQTLLERESQEPTSSPA